MMYINTSKIKIIKKMKRTQIYLDEDLIKILKIESKIKGVRMSELIREALRKEYLKGEKKIYIVDEIAGLWRNRKLNVDKYIRSFRRGKRLRRLYGGSDS